MHPNGTATPPPDEGAVVRVIQALGRIGPAAGEADEPLAELWHDPREGVRKAFEVNRPDGDIDAV